MTLRLTRRQYADLYGPTTGDRVRLADTDLLIRIEHDLTVPGEEAKFGGGKVIRDGMGQASRATRADCPMPSRITLPPPNFASSPGTVRSRSIRMSRSVSARRTRSPVVGP